MKNDQSVCGNAIKKGEEKMLPNYVKDNDQFDKISKFTISHMEQIKKKSEQEQYQLKHEVHKKIRNTCKTNTVNFHKKKSSIDENGFMQHFKPTSN